MEVDTTKNMPTSNNGYFYSIIVIISISAVLTFIGFKTISAISIIILLPLVFFYHKKEIALKKQLLEYVDKENDVDEGFHKADDALTSALEDILPIWKKQIESSVVQSTEAVNGLSSQFMEIVSNLNLAIDVTSGEEGRFSSERSVQSSSDKIKDDLEMLKTTLIGMSESEQSSLVDIRDLSGYMD